MRKIFLFLIILLSQLAGAQQKQMTLEDAIIGNLTYLRPETLNGLLWKNDQVFSYVENNILWAEDVKKGEKTQVIDLPELASIVKKENVSEMRSFPSHKWLKNENILLNYGHYFFSVNLLEKSTDWEITMPENAENEVFNEPGTFVSYTMDEDLFVTFATGKTVQITTDGGEGIVNGKSVHRSEFGISNGIFNSPQGNFIAFYRKDETMVTDYPLVDYMQRVAEHVSIKYPMAGMNSHQVTLGVYNIATGKTTFLDTGEPDDHYLTNIAWSPDEKFIYIAELNRDQDHMVLNSYSSETGEKVKTLFETKNNKYVEPLHSIIFSKVNSKVFYHLSRQDGWFHVYKYNTEGEQIQQITQGKWEVTGILGFDEKEKFIFVVGTKDSPLERHIYRVEIKTGKIEKLTEPEGVHQGILSPDGNFLIDNFSAPDIPSNSVLLSDDGKIIRTLHSAENPLENFNLGENKLISIPSADGQYELTGRIIFPVDFDPAKKYPVIIYVYGGPHSQLVDKRWNNAARWWQYYMASQGFISLTLDNRGTNNRGMEFESATFRRLGVLETEDQMQGVKFLKNQPYVDSERIGVHGWSYGGFITLNLMLRHPEVFKVGVAGGPVVDWSLYEVMYGERYMDRPFENISGYEETNMVNHVVNLEGKLMLIHGVLDDVVVMQHSMMFLRECIKQGKQVDFFTYPTHTHNIRGINRLHLMEKVSRYFLENL